MLRWGIGDAARAPEVAVDRNEATFTVARGQREYLISRRRSGRRAAGL